MSAAGTTGTRRVLPAALTLALLHAPACLAQQVEAAPVAIVERVTGGARGVARFDLLDRGAVVELAGGAIVLGYLQTCWQDSVSGDRIVVGAHYSRVETGAVTRRRVECDAPALALAGAGEPRSRAAVALVRETPEPDITLYGRSPVFLLPAGADGLVIERLDAGGETVRAEAAGGPFDAAGHGIGLAPGGVYRATAGSRSIVFRIDPLAEEGEAPVVGRLVILR